VAFPLIVHNLILKIAFFSIAYRINWLDAMATITIISKISMATIQTQPLFDAGKQILCPYFRN